MQRIKNIIKKVLFTILTLLFLSPIILPLLYGIFFIKMAFFFSWRLVDDIYVAQRPFQGRYDLYVMNFWRKERIIEYVSEWIVSEHYFYGLSNNGFFLIDRDTLELTWFNDQYQFSEELVRLGLPHYNMTDPEGVVDIRYGLGRDRKYPLSEYD